MAEISGKIALITGAAHGIGLATAQLLMSNGAKGVAICDVDTTRGEKAAESINKEHGKGRAIFIKTDVTKPQDLEDAFKKTKENFGTIDIVINNAGIINDAQWEKELDINVRGVIRGTNLGIRYMDASKSGSGGTIVNIASVAGLGLKSASPVYDGSKYFVVGFTRSIASPPMDQSHGVRFLCMCPGLTDTPIADGVLDGYERMKIDRNVILNALTMQQPDNVAKGIVEMIKKGTSGSVWVSDKNEDVYEVSFPDLVKS